MFESGPANDIAGPRARQPFRRHQLRLVDDEAQPSPRQPEHRRQRPRHRARLRLVPGGGRREDARPVPLDHPAPGLSVLPRCCCWRAQPPHPRLQAGLQPREDGKALARDQHDRAAPRRILTVIFLCLPLGMAFAFLGVQLAVFGLYMGSTFAPNHKGMPLLPRDSKVDFLRRQVLTSRNIKGGWIMDTFMGGLNYQIEHHLFPNMAAAAPAQGAGHRQGILRHPQHPVHRDDADGVVRHRHPVPEPGRAGGRRGPVRVPDGHSVRSLATSTLPCGRAGRDPLAVAGPGVELVETPRWSSLPDPHATSRWSSLSRPATPRATEPGQVTHPALDQRDSFRAPQP